MLRALDCPGIDRLGFRCFLHNDSSLCAGDVVHLDLNAKFLIRNFVPDCVRLFFLTIFGPGGIIGDARDADRPAGCSAGGCCFSV